MERRALNYLARYPASQARLEMVLRRRARREAAGELEGLDALVRSVVVALAERGLVDDRAFAEARARALLRRGRSPRRVRAELTQDGVAAELIEPALRQAAPEEPDLDRAAAVRYARRRGLGPFRPEPERAARRDRDLRALVRQGFGLPLARDVVDAADPASLHDTLA